ncbi:MAG: hypothetical protein EPO36_10415 [Chloroflexota bacterium]|nr:MAG: hypothetical protein EPO36_10415 [Chloroflexota bacterium]
MTPAEELEAALEAAFAARDEIAARALLAELSEAERAELVPVARRLVAGVAKRGIDGLGSLGPALMAAYGILTVTDIRRLGWRSNHISAGLEDVLRRRSPERLGPIVEFLLDEVGGRAWRVVRPLVRDGVVARPDRPSYTIAMLAGTRYRSLAELRADDPWLLDVEVWRLFEVEGGGEDSLANHEKFFGDGWGTVFRELAASGPGMRARLLDASLDALGRDFSTYRAGWYSRFHESLAPTDEERAERAEAYLRLLRSRVGPTVSFTVAALIRLSRAGRLPSDALLDRIGPVLADGPAGTAMSGLDLVAGAGAGSTADPRRAAITATEALANASADVQRAAIALIGKLVLGMDAAVATAMAARLGGIAASQRTSAAALLARLGGGDGGGGSQHAGTTRAEPTADPGPHSVIPPAPGRPTPLDAERAIEPLASIDALVDIAVSVVETGEPADDLERVLDAVGRFGADRPNGFARLTAPLAKRARKILARRESSPFSGFDPRADVAALLLAWTTGEVVTAGAGYGSTDPGAGAFLSGRAREVAEAAAAGRPFRGVSAPTHRGGWIDPVVLVERLQLRPPASRLDLVAALLRLAPDGRSEALAAARTLDGEPGAAVRYALGGDEPVGPTAAWWIAAARVRAPGEDDERVEAAHPGLGPDAGLSARVALVHRKPTILGGSPALDVWPAPTGTVSADLPTVLILREASVFAWSGRSEPAMLRWMATIQPGYREAWAAVGSGPLARNVDWWSAEWANRVYLEPFVDPVTSLGPQARRLVGIALGAREAGERGLAADIVRMALADGRLTASDLAEGLTAAAAVAVDRPNRWAESLAAVATDSPGHAGAVAEAIAGVLPALAERPTAKLVPLLRAYDEILAGAGLPPGSAGRATLATLASAGGQAGRLARSILARA